MKDATRQGQAYFGFWGNSLFSPFLFSPYLFLSLSSGPIPPSNLPIANEETEGSQAEQTEGSAKPVGARKRESRSKLTVTVSAEQAHLSTCTTTSQQPKPARKRLRPAGLTADGRKPLPNSLAVQQ